MVQEVTVVVSQVHERGTEAAHTAQGEDSANATAPGEIAHMHFCCWVTYYQHDALAWSLLD